MADPVDSSPRPDLARIVRAPILPALAADAARGLTLPESSAGPDFLLAVERQRRPGPDDVGFGLAQALAVTERVRELLGPAPALLAIDRDRAAALLFERD